MNDDVKKLEREVDIARSRFKSDLAVLNSPRTYAAFKKDLKREANSTVYNLVEGLKARAAANPSSRACYRCRHCLARDRAAAYSGGFDWRGFAQLISDEAGKTFAFRTAGLFSRRA